MSKYSWCGQPCDLEREEHGRGAKGMEGEEAKWPQCWVGGLPRMGTGATGVGFVPSSMGSDA